MGCDMCVRFIASVPVSVTPYLIVQLCKCLAYVFFDTHKNDHKSSELLDANTQRAPRLCGNSAVGCLSILCGGVVKQFLGWVKVGALVGDGYMPELGVPAMRILHFPFLNVSPGWNHCRPH